MVLFQKSVCGSGRPLPLSSHSRVRKGLYDKDLPGCLFFQLCLIGIYLVLKIFLIGFIICIANACKFTLANQYIIYNPFSTPDMPSRSHILQRSEKMEIKKTDGWGIPRSDDRLAG